MILANAITVITQLALPAALLLWLWLRPASSTLSYGVQVVVIALYFFALCVVPMWLAFPWWVPRLFVAIAGLVLATQLATGVSRRGSHRPQIWKQWTGTGMQAVLASGLLVIVLVALDGRKTPPGSVDLAFPLGPGTYLVVNGGSTELINAHVATLEPETDRQRAYRGQSFAVDLVQTGSLGMRATGWRQRDPANYEIFGQQVLAPCAGRIIAARDDRQDMPVPVMDSTLLEGNHVFIDCADYGVLLAHFRQGSLLAASGDVVQTGDALGEAGNSGQSGEPHLHVHAQRIPESGPLLAGEPLHVTFNGRYLVRNDRLTIEPGR